MKDWIKNQIEAEKSQRDRSTGAILVLEAQLKLLEDDERPTKQCDTDKPSPNVPQSPDHIVTGFKQEDAAEQCTVPADPCQS